MKNTKNQIKVNETKLTKKEQVKVLGGGDIITYTCVKCNCNVQTYGPPPSVCLVCGTVGGFAVTGRTST